MSNVLTFAHLSKYKTISHGISTKAFGSMKNPDGTVNVDNVRAFTEALGLQSSPICMEQIHSGDYKVIEDSREAIIPKIDGLITNKKQIPLAIVTADCLPILLYDPQKQVIGVVHAGYKGVLKHMIENIISGFTSTFQSDPKDIIVGIGPNIEMSCYEVGKEIIDQFESTFPTFKNMYTKKDGKFYLDVKNVGRQCLLQKGILEERIEISPYCTRCNSDILYSARGGDALGRFVSIISLV